MATKKTPVKKRDILKSSTKTSKRMAKEATVTFSSKPISDPTSLKAKAARVGKAADKTSNKLFNKRLKKKLAPKKK